MTDPIKRSMLRAIPPVDELLEHPALAEGRRDSPNFPWTRLIRAVLDDFRGLSAVPEGVEPADRKSVSSWIVSEIRGRVDSLRAGGQRRVFNGTGVVLHTNLGRAVLGPGVSRTVSETLEHYVNLELDLVSGQRGFRSETLNELLTLATGGESAMVVNNNAAAVYLVVNSYSPPGRVIVSRGELVEIGGSFRLPEILRHAAAEVVEVGTTNRTYAQDYKKAARPDDLILKVHKSNYAIEGFAHEATPGELAAVAAEAGCYFVYDLGSGTLFDYRSAGLAGDERVDEILASNVDCVTMSGDKLLGGVQAGILIGKRAFIGKLKQNPLRRAVRIDKVSIAALQEVLRRYLFGTGPSAAVPILEQILAPVDTLRKRAAAVIEGLPAGNDGSIEVSVVDDDAAVGGGSLSSEIVSSVAISFRCAGEKNAVELARSMRLHTPPIIPRIKGNEVRINMRSILSQEDGELGTAIKRVLAVTGSKS